MRQKKSGCKLPHKIPYTLEGYLTRKLPNMKKI